MGKKIAIVGCGPGAADLVTLRGKRVIEEADFVVGSKRLLADFVGERKVKAVALEGNYQEVLEEVGRMKKDKRVVFLVSGDPLFYSLGESIIKRFGKENCEVIPGVASFQHAFCQLKEGWKDYRVFSLHGVKETDIERIFRENERFILLLDPKQNLKSIKKKMGSLNEGRYTFYVASNLSMPDERIAKVFFDDFDNFLEKSLSILIVRRPGKDEDE